MAYDEVLADRVREVISLRDQVTEKKMFGGIAWMVGGNMACGVSSGGDLIVRLDPQESEKALAEPGVRVFDMTGRPMRGWLLVEPEAIEADEQLAGWVDAGAGFASSLPAK